MNGGPRSEGREADDTGTTDPTGSPGVLGAEVWVKVGGPPPVDPNGLTFLALDTRTPYTAEHPGTDGGEPAHYMLRWPALDATVWCQVVNSTWAKGPWSETATATIDA